MTTAELKPFLAQDTWIDFNSELFQQFVAEVPKKDSPIEQAIAIYEYVRDYFRYDPYHIDLREEAFHTENLLAKKRAWCVEKAAVTVAVLRYFDIPSRFGFGIVKNHIRVEKLIGYLQREEIVFHGFTDVFLEGKWVKCTPAFDPGSCKIAGVPVLEWDGKSDSLFQPFSDDREFMEYLHFYGSFNKIPIELMHSEMFAYYPHLFKNPVDSKVFAFKFDEEIIRKLQ